MGIAWREGLVRVAGKCGDNQEGGTSESWREVWGSPGGTSESWKEVGE